MSLHAHEFVKSPMVRPSTPVPASAGMLQRQCACGNARGPSGDCAECRRKRSPGDPLQSSWARPNFRILAAVGETTDSASPATPTEDSAEQQETAPTSSGCSPNGLSRADFLQEPGASQNEFGLTSLDLGQVTFPEVQLTGRAGRRRLQSTQAALPTIPSIYTASGTFTEGEVIFRGQNEGDCPSGRYPNRWMITRDGAQKIRDGEAEHCGDYQFAFGQSLAPFRDAVNRLATARTRFASRRSAERRLRRITGIHPNQWQTVFACLACKSKVIRDNRLRLHTPRPRTIPPSYRSNCEFARTIISGTSLRGVGTRTPDQIITGCTTADEQQRIISQCT